MKLIEKTVKLEESLRQAFKRRRYGPGDYLPDFDLFEVAADHIAHLRYMLGNIAANPCTPEIIKQYARGDLHGQVHGWEKDLTKTALKIHE